MGKALQGEHYCADHQGNHSHYDPHNCTVCVLKAENQRLREALKEIADDRPPLSEYAMINIAKEALLREGE